MQAAINVAEGDRQSSILKGEGEALKIAQEARGIVESLKLIGNALENPAAERSAKLKLCESYMRVLTTILKDTDVVMLPPGQKDGLLSTVAASLSLYNRGKKSNPVAEELAEIQRLTEAKIQEAPKAPKAPTPTPTATTEQSPKEGQHPLA